MKVIIGLGNPGLEYMHTRHNIGWIIIDALADKLGVGGFKEQKKFKALTAETTITKSDENTNEEITEKILLVKPTTFMNLSGESVIAIKNFYKLENEDFLIIYDDIDLPLGELRFRDKGVPGTLNGMKSIVQHLGQEFPRLRFGIESRPEELKGRINLSDYVLSRFPEEEKDTTKKAIGQALEEIIKLLG